MTSIHSNMATSSSSSPVLCRFFKQGICKFGVVCRFSHQTLSENASISNSGAHHASTSDNSEPAVYPTRVTTVCLEDWVNAPEFTPLACKSTTAVTNTNATMSQAKSYAQVVRPEGMMAEMSAGPAISHLSHISDKLCPYAKSKGDCPYQPGECNYVHGDICELCGLPALHPRDQEQRRQHQRECVSQHEKNMELSFAVARSRDKSCGICFEVILEKSSGEQRFGILPNCNHCFCLSCIRKWRQAKQFDFKITRACPECRVPSMYICPSMYWVETKEDKEKLITDYLGALKTKDCKYFNRGRGKCPFGNRCFYLHALRDGTKIDIGPPVRHHRQVHDIEFQPLMLWEFLEDRDSRWLYSLEELDDLVAFLSDSEDSDWSEIDYFLN